MVNTRIVLQPLRGVCCFHSETGTEGGYWAFQDETFITKNVPRDYCKKCGKYLDREGSLKIMVVKMPRAGEALEATRLPMCPDGQHEREISDVWSYAGLHILKNGDHLTIFSPDNPTQVVWSGTIHLRQHSLFSEDAFGLWIHADQSGVTRNEWATYFLKEYPAELLPARKP
ncbi:MAG TPA: hypothetical protein VJH33_03895 [Candidatus Paceibacterota bacterium]